jgi:hypothetical protein
MFLVEICDMDVTSLQSDKNLRHFGPIFFQIQKVIDFNSTENIRITVI